MKGITSSSLFFIALYCSFHAYSKTENSNKTWLLPNSIWYDAKEVTGIRGEGYLKLEGNATLLLGNIYINAERIIIYQKQNLMTAEGHARIIYDREKAVASKIVLDLETKQVRMDNAQVIADPDATEDEVNKKALGLSKAEVAFDEARNTRTEELENELKSLRIDYSNLLNLLEIDPASKSLLEKKDLLKGRYAQLLARYTRTQFQPNLYLDTLPPKEREKFLKRRESVKKFNSENPELTKQIMNFNYVPGYIKISASRIFQKDPHTFQLNNAIISPCHCSAMGEPPIFGFTSQNAVIDVGDDITLQGTTIDFFSIPVIYAPWFRVSIKNQRESGFLYPSGYASNNAGQSVSIPYYLTLGKHADTTFTYSNFSTRGSHFQSETRVQLFDGEKFQSSSGQTLTDNGLYSFTQFISDKKYKNDWKENNNKINQAISQNPSQYNIYNSFRGPSENNRWYNEESLNIPLSNWGAIKTNGQFVSDNTFLADYSPSSIIDPTSAVRGDTTPSSRRFLTQEIDGEFYGNNVILSAQAQQYQDLFAESQNNIPFRFPKMEFTLLPKRYFNLPFSYSQETEWENVGQKGTQTYLPIAANFAPGETPYIQGNRLYSSSQVTLPLSFHRYFNTSISASATIIQYNLPASNQQIASNPMEEYMQYSFHADVPFSAELNRNPEKNNTNAHIFQQLFTPFVDFNYIPNVYRERNFPNTFISWYAADTVASKADMVAGINTSWNIKHKIYQKQPGPLKRFYLGEDLPVADLRELALVAEEKNIALEKNNPKSIFYFTKEEDANVFFKAWAQKELEKYRQAVLEEDFGRKNQWPSDGSYDLVTEKSYTPLSLTIASGYNFTAEKTTQDLNNFAGPNFQTPYAVSSFDNINSTLNWNLDPLLALNGTLTTDYSYVYHRFTNASAGAQWSLPIHVVLSYSRAIQYVISSSTASLASVTPVIQNQFVEKTQDYASAIYNPLQWVALEFQWSQITDPTATTVNTTEGRSYASSYSINLANIQGCLDLILARNKPAGTSENSPIYSIGINLKIFGYSSGNQEIGSYINKKLQQ